MLTGELIILPLYNALRNSNKVNNQTNLQEAEKKADYNLYTISQLSTLLLSSHKHFFKLSDKSS